jgi:hypothetical protein
MLYGIVSFKTNFINRLSTKFTTTHTANVGVYAAAAEL